MLINQCKKFRLNEHKECLLSECTVYLPKTHSMVMTAFCISLVIRKSFRSCTNPSTKE